MRRSLDLLNSPVSFYNSQWDIRQKFWKNNNIIGEEVRSQWKNLKDTFVRKLRYISEGKYAYDQSKEITWKFYKMLSFLDDNKKKTVENPVADHPIFDIAVLQREHGLDLVKNDIQFENSNHSASSEDLMQSLFVQVRRTALIKWDFNFSPTV